MKVVWTKQAQRDLAAIYNYIAADSPYYAAQVVNTCSTASTKSPRIPWPVR